jgi:predicted DNA binding CopG/RHH family protein
MIQVNNNIKEDTVKLSCYVDKKLFEEVKKKSSDIGLSISAYLRFLVKKDLNN